MDSNIDYTRMRKGSKPDKLRPIVVCEKCGRKGHLTIIDNKKDPDNSCAMVTHKAHLIGIPDVGIAFLHIDESCMYKCDQIGHKRP